MIHYIYKITLTTGSLKDHYYIGQHSTDDINDGYKGSGVIVKDYYKKHPTEYKKVILCYCDSIEELNQKEYELIGNLWETDNMCLNLRPGGDRKGCSIKTRKKISAANKGRKRTNETKLKMSIVRKGRKFTEEHKSNISTSMKLVVTPEYRAKLSSAKKGKYVGDKASHKTPITIQNIITNEILTFGCIKDCAEYLQVKIDGAFRNKFLKGLPTRVPQLKNWKIAKQS